MIDAPCYLWEFSSEALTASFMVERAQDPAVELQVSRERDLPRAGADPVFVAGRLGSVKPGWSLSRQQDQWIFEVNHAQSSQIARRLAVLQSDFSRGRVSVVLSAGARTPYPYPLEYPLDRLLLINYLPSVEGGLFHACGIDDGGAGLLFVGPQESGKSTLARLWAAHSGATVLSDECVVVRKHDDGFWMYGTPWAGGAGASSPTRVRLRRIFFIAHGVEHRLLPIRQLDIVSQLLVESFPTFWDHDRMESMLGLCEQVGKSVPCHRLEFVPTADVIGFVRRSW